MGHRPSHGVEELVVAEGFSEMGDRPGSADQIQSRGIVAPGDEHRRQGSPDRTERLYESDAAHARKIDVRHEAIEAFLLSSLQEFFGGRERPGREVGRLQQIRHGRANTRVVVDDRNPGVRSCHLRDATEIGERWLCYFSVR